MQFAILLIAVVFRDISRANNYTVYVIFAANQIWLFDKLQKVSVNKLKTDHNCLFALLSDTMQTHESIYLPC